jgi:Subtilisin inhibitor-like
MRIAVLTAVLVAAVGCGAGTSSSATATTSLRISFWPAGQDGGGVQRWTLRCAPAAGTLPRPGAACAKLAAMRNPFAPPSKDLQCTQIYGGPQVAVISGTFRGRKIWVKLAARDGCEIARAKELGFLVPGMASASPS